MRLSANNMRHRKEYLEKLIDLKIAQISGAPSGSIRVSESNGSYQYYYRAPGTEAKATYVKSNERQFAASIVQREYDEKVLIAAKSEAYHLNGILSRYEHGTAEDIYDKLPPARRALVTPVLLPDDEFAKNWLAQPYEGLGFEEGAPEYYADSGLRVRSKSEIGISNKYDEYDIPMLFERPLKLKGWKTVYPDFTLLNVRLRKEYIHEHLGMMDDPVYLMENIAKVNAYMKNGYFPGKNLILTFETKSQPFDMRIMDEIIKQYLL